MTSQPSNRPSAGRRTNPGPPRLPLVGSLPWLDMKRGRYDFALSPLITAHKIALIQVGVLRYIHVINDFDTAKELFGLEVFSGKRVEEYIAPHYFLSGSIPEGIAMTTGDTWSVQRRFGLRSLRDLGFGKKSLEATMAVEIEGLIERYHAAAAQGGDVKIGTDFNIPVINILWQLVAGNRIQLADEKETKLLDMVNSMFTKGVASFWLTLPYPFLKVFPNFTGYTRVSSNMEALRDYMLETIEQHIVSFDKDYPRDFIDAYLVAMNEDQEGKYTKAHLNASLMDFFIAGSETTSTTLKWCLLQLTNHQGWTL